MLIARADWPRLLSLVEQALDLPAAEREGWLRTLDLSDDLKLALRSLLDERRALETEDFLGALPPILEPDERLSSDRGASAPGRLQAGTLIGPWRLLREIGQGGMSTVWLAERADEQVTRQVALKLPHAGPGQDLLAARLLRERNILAALEHRNIARLYDVGLTDAGTPYLVMEYVAGDTLLAHADRLKLGIPQRLALFQQVLRAVQYAHGKLVLHRDLKPSNILVNEAGDVKLLDFGIAKVLAAEGHTHDETELTRSAGRQLTPAYASPEQLCGEALGTASDIFSLGVLLYELLAGQRPFAALGGSAAQLEDAVLNREAKAPSRVAADAAALAARACSAPQLKSTLTGDLDAIVLKSLNKLPAQRYAAVETLAADVAHWLANEPVSAQTPSGWYHLRKFVLRHRLGVSLGAGVTVLVVLSSTAAVVQGVKAREEARRANASRDFLLGIFEDTDPEAITGRELSAKEILARSRAKLLLAGTQDALLPVPPLLRGIADAQRRLADPVGGVATLRSLLDALPSTGADADRFDVLLEISESCINLNQLVEAKSSLAQVLTLLRRHQATPAQYRRMAFVAGRLASYESVSMGNRSLAQTAVDAFHAYFELASQPDHDSPLNQLHARLNLAKAESLLNRLDSAQAELQRAVELARQHQDSLPPSVEFRPIATYRASVDSDWGQYDHVLSWPPPVVERCTQVMGIAHEDCLVLAGHVIRAQLKVGQAVNARRLGQMLKVQTQNNQSPRRQLEAAVLMARASAWSHDTLGLKTSRKLLESRVEPALRSELPPALRLQALNTLAEVTLAMGHPADALDWVHRAQALTADQALSPSAREVLKTSLFEGIALQAQGKHRAALQAMASHCDLARLAQSRQFAVLDHLFSLNCVPSLRALGDADQAQRLLNRALPVLQPALGASSPNFVRARALVRPDEPAGKPAPQRPAFFS